MQEELSTPLALRDARPQDVPELVGLINMLNTHEGAQPTMTESHAEFVLFSPQRPVPLHCLVATYGPAIAGFMLYYHGYDTASTSFGYHIADVFVKYDRRGRGIGRILMAEVAKRCVESGGQWCSLTAAHDNAGAQAFYDAMGFQSPDVSFRAIGPRGLGALCCR